MIIYPSQVIPSFAGHATFSKRSWGYDDIMSNNDTIEYWLGGTITSDQFVNIITQNKLLKQKIITLRDRNV